MSIHYHIVGRAKGREDTYYCECSTQGARMIPFAISMAKQFKTRKAAQQIKPALKAKFKGLIFRVTKDADCYDESMADRPDWY